MGEEEKQFNETLNKYANNFTNEDAYLINDYLTTLQQENQQLKKQLEKCGRIKKEIHEKLIDFLCTEYYCSQGKELYDFCSELLCLLLVQC